MKITTMQQKAYEFLQKKRGASFTTQQLVDVTGYARGSARTNLGEHWPFVKMVGEKWQTISGFARLSPGEFAALASQDKSKAADLLSKTILLLDACVVIPYYVSTATNSVKLRERSAALIDAVRSSSLNAQMYIPNFCIAEVFSVFTKYGFSNWSKQVKKTLTPTQYRRAVDHFQADIHNGSLMLQYELNRYHILGINLVAPIDHNYQLGRPNRKTKSKPNAKKQKPQPAGTFDQLIISMGAQLARVHGAQNTVIVSADARLCRVAEKCRSGINPASVKKLGLNRCEEIVGLPFRPETFPNVIDLKRAPRGHAERMLGLKLPK